MTGLVEKVYSQALFDIGVEENRLDAVYKDVMSVSEIFGQNPNFIKLLTLHTVSLNEKLLMLKNIFQGKIDPDVFNFLCLLTSKNRTGYILKIANLFKDRYNQHIGVMEITVTTTEPLSALLREKLVAKIGKVFGKKITLIENVDTQILGGIVLNYGNTLIDSSVKIRLDEMKFAIANTLL